jgi:hypothetical protein
MALAAACMLSACATDVSPTVSSRGYQGVDAQSLAQSAAQAFINTGYIITEAKWEQKPMTGQVEGKPVSGIIHEYGPVKLPGDSSRHCLKIASVKITSIPNPQFSLVQLQSAEVICYNAINKVNLEIDTDEKTYQRYFKALTALVGRDAIPVGAGE